MVDGSKTLRQKFNELYLPIQWLSDVKNPGKLDGNELWVPTLKAYNAYCQKQGLPTVDPEKIAQDALTYLQLPESQQVNHPLLTKDLASRRMIPFQFDLSSIPAGPKKEAMKELIKVVALSDLYHKVAMDPNYARQMQSLVKHIEKKPGDLQRLQHFWFSGGSKCISDKDEKCSAVDGLSVPKDINGVWWPEGLTKADADHLFKEYKWSSGELKQKVFTPGSRVVTCKEGDKDAFTYKGKWYRPVSMNTSPEIKILANMMADHLKEASAILKDSDPGLSLLLRKRSDNIRMAPLFGDPELDKTWATLKNKEILTSFGNVENYAVLGTPFGMKAAMQGILGYVNPRFQAFVQGIESQMHDGDDRLWALWDSSKGEKFPVEMKHTSMPEVAVVDIVFNGGAFNYPGYIPGGFNQPNYNNYISDVPKEQQKSKLIYFGPVIAARIQNQGVPVAKQVFDTPSIAKLEKVVGDIPSIITFVQAHEVNHSRAITASDKVFVSKIGDESSLDDLYGHHLGSSMEEGKADLLGLFDLPLYEKAGLITAEQKEMAAWTHFGNLLRNLNLGKKDEHGRGAIMEFYLFCKHGIVTYDDKTKRYSVDMEKMHANIGDVVKEYLNIYLSFDKERAETFDKEAQTFFEKSPMYKAVQGVQAAGLPGDNVPYYIVKGDLGAF